MFFNITPPWLELACSPGLRHLGLSWCILQALEFYRSSVCCSCCTMETHGKTCSCPLKSFLDSNRHIKGLRDRNSPTCTLSQNGYGDNVFRNKASLAQNSRHQDTFSLKAEHFPAYLLFLEFPSAPSVFP